MPTHISDGAMREIERGLEQYVAEVEQSRMKPSTKKTYVRHVSTYVRWLKGDFTPGERV